MALTKISQLTSLASNEVTASIDLLAIVDTTNTETKNITIDNLLSGANYNSGSFSGSFQGDGSGITGVISEWDGSHNGNASITGSLTVTSDISSSSNIMVNALSFDGGSTSRKYIVIDIGDWNMDTGASTTAVNTITEWQTIRDVTLLIRDDADTTYYSGADGDVQVKYTSALFVFTRTAAGIFDNTNFDSSSYNRGYVRFSYQPD